MACVLGLSHPACVADHLFAPGWFSRIWLIRGNKGHQGGPGSTGSIAHRRGNRGPSSRKRQVPDADETIYGMLTLVTTPSGPGLGIQPVAPMVYLDHWALRKFADDPELGSRFARAIRARGGTLALSWLNLGEFARVSDPE